MPRETFTREEVYRAVAAAWSGFSRETHALQYLQGAGEAIDAVHAQLDALANQPTADPLLQGPDDAAREVVEDLLHDFLLLWTLLHPSGPPEPSPQSPYGLNVASARAFLAAHPDPTQQGDTTDGN